MLTFKINDVYISDQSGILGLARACAITLRRFRNRKRMTRYMLSYACSIRADLGDGRALRTTEIVDIVGSVTT